MSEPPTVTEAWRHALGERWNIWVDWYDDVSSGSPPAPARGEAWEEAFTDLPSPLPWEDGPEAVSLAIRVRLGKLGSELDPQPVDDVPSAIEFIQLPDGRIGAEAGSIAKPAFPSSSAHTYDQSLAACRNRADRLREVASQPGFQARGDYADLLKSYLACLPKDLESGNMILADGDARVLTRLMILDDGALPIGFATQLSVLLEDHIALRAFYPQVENHYLAVKTGRLTAPLERDAVEGIQKVIHANTPEIFDESVEAAIGITARPLAEAPFASKEMPLDLAFPKPPKDPIVDVDPATTRNFTFAAAVNGLWRLLQKGPGAIDTVAKWQKVYEQLKPYVRPALDWLRSFYFG